MGTLTRIALNVFIVFLAISAGIYQIYFKPVLAQFGIRPARLIQALGNKKCKGIPELQACEEIILHQPTGVLYLACSTPLSREHWIPALNQLNATGASTEDYVATYDPATSRITRLTTPDFNGGRGLSLHGMDVVPSMSNPSELFVYLVNHRIPLGDAIPAEVGADSVIEIFTTTVGGTTLKHKRTIENPIIATPNSVTGSADGQSFYFTNDHGVRVGLIRYLELLGHRNSSVGYCHVNEGCKYALTKTHASNGITTAPNGTVYLADSTFGVVDILEPQSDHTLVLTDSVKTDMLVDNLAVDAAGQLWVAGIPLALASLKHMAKPSSLSPSTAFRLSINTGPNSFYGEKYRVQKVFEDDGSLMSGITSVVYDSIERSCSCMALHLLSLSFAIF
ncbi:hypothetical protein M413DRAFT_442080, partial [Hebeloma cylindrosporum]